MFAVLKAKNPLRIPLVIRKTAFENSTEQNGITQISIFILPNKTFDVIDLKNKKMPQKKNNKKIPVPKPDQTSAHESSPFVCASRVLNSLVIARGMTSKMIHSTELRTLTINEYEARSTTPHCRWIIPNCKNMTAAETL
jgi:hypothetical protein